MSHVCDCGIRYSNLDALMACQSANHGIPRDYPIADSFMVGQSADGKIELKFSDRSGVFGVVAHLLPADLPSFISTILSIGGYDELGRDFAVALQKKMEE